MKHLAIIALFVSIAAFAQQPPKAPENPKTVPVISAEQQKAFYKAQSQQVKAQDDLREAMEKTPEYTAFELRNQVYQTTITDLIKFCGNDAKFMLIKNGKPDNDGDPTCVAKHPEPAKAAEPTKK